MRFRDRRDAGRQLAEHLDATGVLSASHDLIVLGLPRGGVPVAAEVAAAFSVPLEVFVARKIGAPGQEELGIGAVAEGGGETVVTGMAIAAGIDTGHIERLAARQRVELERRVQRYRAGRPLPDLSGRDVVLVDDGLATGVTAEAALRSLRGAGTGRLLLAVPVCSPDTRERLAAIADDVVCLVASSQLRAVGAWYENFDQTTDEEVVELLALYHAPTQR